MRNPRYQEREKVRIDFSRSVLNAAANLARQQGKSLSGFIENLVLEKTGGLPAVTERVAPDEKTSEATG
jgi:hypothetical protein